MASLRRFASVTTAAWLLVGCSSSDNHASQRSAAPTAGSTEPSANCAVATDGGSAADDPSVLIIVDDIQGGFGRLGARAQRPQAGVVAVGVEADADNDGPVTVIIHRVTPDGPEVGRIAGVPPGQRCTAEFDLVAGPYVATADSNDGAKAGFEVFDS